MFMYPTGCHCHGGAGITRGLTAKRPTATDHNLPRPTTTDLQSDHEVAPADCRIAISIFKLFTGWRVPYPT